ncbi:MAG: hypothetical protein AB7L41_02900 [Flavobacteriaceae bacterium]
MARFAGLGLAATMLLAAGSAEAGREIDRYEVGYWAVYAWEQDDGSFGHCGIETNFKDGTTLIVAFNDSGVIVTLGNDDWQLGSGDTYRVSLQIDGRYRRNANLDAVSQTIGSIELGWDNNFWSAFRSGNKMRIESRSGQAWNMSLRGTSKASVALKKCYDIYGKRSGSSANPFD